MYKCTLKLYMNIIQWFLACILSSLFFSLIPLENSCHLCFPLWIIYTF